MGWATEQITQLKAGKTVSFRPQGNSMTPRVKNGQLVTVAPLGPDAELQLDEVVLCRVNGNDFLHLVKAVRRGEVLIGNAHGKLNGWTARTNVFGRLVKLED